MVVGGNLRGELGFFQGIINNLIGVANPTAFWFVDLVRIEVFVSISHIIIISHIDNFRKL